MKQSSPIQLKPIEGDEPAPIESGLETGEYSLVISNSEYQQLKVLITIVPDIPDTDYPQAKKAWEALVEAGIEPGELVANALHQGHDYPVTELTRLEHFKPKQENLTGESQSSEEALVSYIYTEAQTAQKYLALPNQQSLILSSRDLEKFEQAKTTGEVVKLVAIIRFKPVEIASEKREKLA